MPDCRFCGAEAKLTGEHVFPDWIRKATGGDGGARYFRRKADGTVDQWQTLAYKTKVKDVCLSCNSGWMSEIEAAVIPILTPMIFDSAAAELHEPQLTYVATWAVLRSLVVPLAAGPDDLPIGYYRTLHRHRKVLPNTAVWLGHLDGTDARTAFFIGVTLDSNIDREGDKPDGYIATMAIGELVTRVFILDPGIGELGPVSNVGYDENLVRVWPNVDAASWPPKALDVASYTGLIRELPRASARIRLDLQQHDG